MTRLEMTIHSASATREHAVELPPRANTSQTACGRLRVALDGAETEIDWAEITPGLFSIIVGGRSYDTLLTRGGGQPAARGSPLVVAVGTRQYVVEIHDPRLWRPGNLSVTAQGPQEILASMPGKIVKMLVSENQEVGPGDGLVVIEAMKMQNELRAARRGRVEKIYVVEGAAVEAGFKLLRLGELDAH